MQHACNSKQDCFALLFRILYLVFRKFAQKPYYLFCRDYLYWMCEVLSVRTAVFVSFFHVSCLGCVCVFRVICVLRL